MGEHSAGVSRLRPVIEIDGASTEAAPWRLRRLLTTAISSLLRTGYDHSDATRVHFQNLARSYRERWAQGDLDAILPMLSDMLSWLRERGIDVATNADVVALFNDPLFANLRSHVPAVDPRLLALLRRAAVDAPQTN